MDEELRRTASATVWMMLMIMMPAHGRVHEGQGLKESMLDMRIAKDLRAASLLSGSCQPSLWEGLGHWV